MSEPDFASLRIGKGWTAPEAGIYRFVVPLPELPAGVVETRFPRDDNPPPGPWP